MTVIIPENKISDIKNSVNIVDIVAEVVLLKKTGKNHSGLCPFHSEKTPSFTVSSEKQMFYCFGCGVGGDVFEFLKRHEGVSFPEAAQILARKYGIEIPTRSMSPEQKKRMTERETIYAINKQAMSFYLQNLLHKRFSQEAMAYLLNRGMKKEIIDGFSLGYAPEGWDNLIVFLRKKGIPLDLAERSGLIISKRDQQNKVERYYDRFRNRIIFPIFNTSQQVIGFGGRVMDSSLPKYLNSPETPLYIKSRSLYGLHAAKNRCRESGRVFVVEGYMDFLSLYQHGIKNSVATLGTALTPDHIRALKGHIGQNGKVILVYDSDEAGINAAKRSIGVFDKEDVDAYILELPTGYDPDSYIMKFGADSFKERAAKAPSTMFFLVAFYSKKYGESVEGKIRMVSDMMGPLSTINDNVKRSLYIQAIAERTGVALRGPVPLPTKHLRVPCRKSPDGEGTETWDHWEMRIHKRLIDLDASDRALRQLMRIQVPDGVHIEIVLKS